jgi:4-hydroxy-tetrahydrodipicolinate synthase
MSVMHGVIPAVVTPFHPDGALDEESLKRVVAHQLEAGADGLLILGLAGEGIHLSQWERERVTELAAGAAGKTPLLVGCSADTTEDATALVAGAVQRGAAAVMVAPPRRADWSAAQFAGHYQAVSQSAGAAEVMVQDAPFAIGVELGVELVLALAHELPNLRSYKIEALPFWENALHARASAGDTLGVFGGHGGLYLLDVLDARSDGLIPGSDVTAALVRAWRAYQAGDRATCVAEHLRLLPLLVFQAQSMALLIGGAKLLLQARGVIASTHSRHPGANLSPVAQARMAQLAHEAGQWETPKPA